MISEKELKMDREKYIDFVRSLAIMLVMLNHSYGYISSNWFEKFGGGFTYLYYIDLIVNSLTRINVPLFFMISGYLMINSDKYDDFKSVSKKFIKTILLIVVWTFIYLTLDVLVFKKPISFLIKQMILLPTGAKGHYVHLWFMYSIALLYLVTPFLRSMMRDNAKNDLYFCILWAVFCCISPMFFHLMESDIPNYMNLYILGGNLGWYVTGYLLMSKRIRLFNKWQCFVTYFIGAILTIVPTIIFGESFYQSFTSIGPLLMSVSTIEMVVLCKENIEKKKSLMNISRCVSKLSLSLYLVHYEVSILVKKICFESLALCNSFCAFVIVPLLVIVISFVISIMINKSPFLRRLVSL